MAVLKVWCERLQDMTEKIEDIRVRLEECGERGFAMNTEEEHLGWVKVPAAALAVTAPHPPICSPSHHRIASHRISSHLILPPSHPLNPPALAPSAERGAGRWPQTVFVDIVESGNIIQPTEKLWNTAWEFQQSHTAWMSGPFNKLDAETVNGAVDQVTRDELASRLPPHCPRHRRLTAAAAAGPRWRATSRP
jgi:hypothetical protein